MATQRDEYNTDDWQDFAGSAHDGARFAALYRDALISQGFTREEALTIIAAHGVSPKYPWMGTRCPECAGQ